MMLCFRKKRDAPGKAYLMISLNGDGGMNSPG
jgi:hypothetical protein